MRLHISPLSPELLPIVLGQRLQQCADSISYHEIDTFPENNYGFVDLPQVDAAKLIAKLNGSILRGRKMKVEEARPKKRKSDNLDREDEPVQRPKRKSTISNEQNTTADVIEGFELPAGRKVKRGWTEPNAAKAERKKSKSKDDTGQSKQRASSKHTDKEELLFRTKVPLNKEALKSTKSSKKRKNSDATTSVVHEFEKTTIQPSFLRDSASGNSTAGFVQGKGWVDQNGDVIEAEPTAAKRSTRRKPEGLAIDLPAPYTGKKGQVEAVGPASSGSLAEDSNGTPTTNLHTNETIEGQDEETSSSGESSSELDSDSDSSDGSDTDTEGQKPTQSNIKQPPMTPTKVHPLEALFKKPQPPNGNDTAKPSLELQTAFSFFDKDATDEDDNLPAVPLTPFTSQELRSRGTRSAAPTPDTAHPSRFNSFNSLTGSLAVSDDSSSDAETNTALTRGKLPSNSSSQSAERPQSEFEKRFWAERGQNNRAWKARSRAARKEQRQKDNRSRRSGHAV